MEIERTCTAALRRQGEWFFLPRPWMAVEADEVLHDQPITHGGARPHLCQQLYRATAEEDLALHASQMSRTSWRRLLPDIELHVRGRILHPDYATIVLPYWHKVVINPAARLPVHPVQSRN